MAKKTQTQCWYCHDDSSETWQTDDGPMPMCSLHCATTRAALALRNLGAEEAADEFDDAIGIDTRPTFCNWQDPAKKA